MPEAATHEVLFFCELSFSFAHKRIHFAPHSLFGNVETFALQIAQDLP
jgi:hypothetical protein